MNKANDLLAGQEIEKAKRMMREMTSTEEGRTGSLVAVSAVRRGLSSRRMTGSCWWVNTRNAT